jgi:hypothetical protein
MDLMVKTGRDEKKPVREVPVPDLWHLASAVAKTGECLAKARDQEILSEAHAEEVLNTLLAEAPLHDGENARQAILDVWHQAHSTTRALLVIEQKLQAILELAEPRAKLIPISEADVLKIRKLAEEALEGGKDD